MSKTLCDANENVQGEFGRRQFLRLSAGAAALGATGGLVSACGGSGVAAPAAAARSKPRRGGRLHAGFSGGSSVDTLNPLNQNDSMSTAYANQMFDFLVAFDAQAQPRLSLASEITPNFDATAWTIRLRPGITFHDGRDLTVDDVIYTFGQIANPKNPAVGGPQLRSLARDGFTKLDKLTLRISFSSPYATFVDALATYYFPVIPMSFDPHHPVGTGPFKFGSCTPGQVAMFTRNESYWQDGLPYVDDLVIDNVADEATQLNGLASGQFDVIDYLSAASVAVARSGGANVAISRGGGFNPFTMRTDQPPFSDVRVRQAFRLLVDRRQMLESVFNGHGIVGNDLYALWDPLYDHSLPQREQDLPQARYLLRRAGMDGLTVELVTSPIAQGVVQSATVLAQQAAAAGVTVRLRNLPTTQFFGPDYLRWDFAQDVWYYNPYFPQIALSDLPTAAFNETHFANERFTTLYRQALSTLNRTLRAEIAHEMQGIYFREGGYIIPYFAPVIDGFAKQVGGVVESRIGLPFNNYDLKSLWLG